MSSYASSDISSVDQEFPLKQIIVLSICRLVEPIAFTSIMSYSYVMVQDLKGDDNASFFANLLISAFAVAEACSALFWGTLSDKYGRRPIVLVGLAGTALSCLLLGFAKNYWLALAARLMAGLLNGNTAVIQTMVTEIVHNPKHEPIAYSMHPLTWNIGSILGSALGGYTAQPARFYPDKFSQDGLFGKYPYLLPNLICVTLITLALCQCFLLLAETNLKSSPKLNYQEEVIEDEIDERTPLRRSFARASFSSVKDPQITQPSLAAGSLSTPTEPFLDIRRTSMDSIRPSDLLSIITSNKQDIGDGDSTLTNATTSTEGPFSKGVLMWILSIVLLCYHVMAFTSMVPIFLLDTPQSQHKRHLDLYGGLGQTVHEVGNILAINGVWSLFVQLIIFPILMSKAGVWGCIVTFTVIAPFIDIAVPFFTMVPNPVFPLAAAYALRTFFYIMIYPGQLIMLKNAAGSTAGLGRINGLTVSLSSVGRTIAPILIGLCYDTVGSAFAWWFCAICSSLSVVQLCFLRKSSTLT